MAQTDYKFEGWMGLDANAAWGNMVWQEFEPKEWEETDIDIKITHCGICGSDLHTLRSGWVNFPKMILCLIYYYQATDLLHLETHHVSLLCWTRSRGHGRPCGIQGH